MALLTIRDLELHYATQHGPVRAVDCVSFTVEESGEAVGIIGETGSGKSSLLLALTRMLPRNVARYSGEVLFADLDLMQLSDERFRREIRWKKISVVFQGAMNGFNPVIRVGRQITERMLLEPKTERHEAREEAERLLETVGLGRDTFDSYPHELSGGMKQRAAIAMALSLKPPLVLLDEPTSALDVSVQAQIMNMLKRLKWDFAVSMLLITHDIALASDLCDRTAVVYAGQIREYGPSEDVLLNPQDPYTRELLASIPRLTGAERPRVVSGDPPSLLAPGAGCRFRARCPQAFDRCENESPELVAVDKTHEARCFLHQESTSDVIDEC